MKNLFKLITPIALTFLISYMLISMVAQSLSIDVYVGGFHYSFLAGNPFSLSSVWLLIGLMIVIAVNGLAKDIVNVLSGVGDSIYSGSYVNKPQFQKENEK